MEAGSLSDLGQRQSLALELEQFMMLSRAQVQHLAPEVVGLRLFAGSRLVTWDGCLGTLARKRLFPLQSAPMLAIAVDESIARGGDQEATQLSAILESPGCALEAVQHIGHDGLDQ